MKGKPHVLVIDNYDSFTYNLVQYMGELGARVTVKRNDEITLSAVENMKPSHIVISPGPGHPAKGDAGISTTVIKGLGGKVPVLGVCLGHQAMGYVFGGKIIRAKKLMHGKTSEIRHDEKTIFRGLSNPFTATRYHSLVVEKKSLPRVLEITATSEDGEIMGLRHKSLANLEGIQFHPESILTVEGKKLLKNFLALRS